MNLKKILQAPMRRRQTLKYENRIVSQTVAYHDWILKKNSRKGKALSCLGRIFPWNISPTAAAGKSFP